VAYPKVQLVASPDVNATVLYDFNVDTTRKVGRDGFDPGVPEWRGEPGVNGGSYDYRTIRFTHLLDATNDTTARASLATLGQRLQAASSWLLIQQRQSSAPTWAKVYRSSPAALSWDRVQIRTTAGSGPAAGKYAIELSLTAEPLLVGALETAGSGTVSNDPASGSFLLPLSTVKGDAPAPAIVSVQPSARTDGALHTLHVTPELAAGTASPILLQVGSSDGWSVSNFGSGVPDADWSGGSYRQTTTGTAGLSRTSTIQPGNYIAYVRAGGPVGAAGVWQFILASSVLGNRFVASDPYTVIAGTDAAQWHRIGRLNVPQGTALTPEQLAAEATVSTFLLLLCNRVAGSGNLNVDALLLVPVSDNSTNLEWMVAATAVDTAVTRDVIDADQRVIVARDTSTGALKYRPNPVARGAYPVLQPGANVMVMLGACAGGAADATALLADVPNRGDVIGVTSTVTVTYRPRYFWPQP